MRFMPAIECSNIEVALRSTQVMHPKAIDRTFDKHSHYTDILYTHALEDNVCEEHPAHCPC